MAPVTPNERRLNDGNILPFIGAGTAPMNDEDSERAVVSAVEVGYRLIDTAPVYRNEVGVGRGIAEAAVARPSLKVMTKLRGSAHGFDDAISAFDGSLERLGLDYLDLYLIHWPLPMQDRYVEAWRALGELRARGSVRSIGVSNFTRDQLDRLEQETGVVPAVNQVEMHPQWRQDDLRRYHADKGIQTLSYSPLGRGTGLLAHPTITATAARLGVTAAQVVLRWHIQLDSIPLPKAGGSDRQRENFDIFGFELSEDDLRQIAGDVHQERIGFDPLTREEY